MKFLATEKKCYHCGLENSGRDFFCDEHFFCCQGCLIAYQVLSGAGLSEYYQLNPYPGANPNQNANYDYQDLDNDDLVCRVCDFQNDRNMSATLFVPQIHCSSCVWLLENLYRLAPGILRSRVNWAEKTVSILWDRKNSSLGSICRLLKQLGYAPQIRDRANINEIEKQRLKSLYLKIGVAGFCFGNVMLLSFPDYILPSYEKLGVFAQLFAVLTFLLSLPVLLFSARDFFESAFQSLKQKRINIEVPLALGLASLFFRSVYDTLYRGEIGYMDSFTGLVFFLLIGKLFKEKTFDSLNFERKYDSYFPLSATLVKGGIESYVALSAVKAGDLLKIRHQQIVPTDSRLLSTKALIDYSFVTGESEPQECFSGEIIYAGGCQLGESIQVEATKEVSQSRLTQLWNQADFKASRTRRFQDVSDKVGVFFTWGTLFVATLTITFWQIFDSSQTLNAATSVLLVACPCAMALAFPFTFGTAQRLLARNGVYLKNMDVLETLTQKLVFVFDKTGTLTEPSPSHVEFHQLGAALSPEDQKRVAVLAHQSAHPLSQALANFLGVTEALPIEEFVEIPGRGLSAKVAGKKVFLGKKQNPLMELGSVVWVEIEGEDQGYFQLKQKIRPGLAQMLESLKPFGQSYLLSGDSSQEQQKMIEAELSGQVKEFLFAQSPQDKMNFIQNLKKQDQMVIMFGDGLNDAGALKVSDVGVAVVDDVNAFSPASDVILNAHFLKRWPDLLQVAHSCKKVLLQTIAISLVYNVIGLSFAVSGYLSPFVSAILMPLSSISVMSYSSLRTRAVLKSFGFLQSEKKSEALFVKEVLA